MLNENKIQNELYRDLSMCIRLYTLKNKCLMKLMKNSSEEKVQEELRQITRQGKIFVDKYHQVTTSSNVLIPYQTQLQHNNDSVIYRFLARIKQITLSFLSKNCYHRNLLEYFANILSKITENTDKNSLYNLLSCIFLFPSFQNYYKKNEIIHDEESLRESSRVPIEKINQAEMQKKIYERFLKGLQEEFQLLEGIELQQREYRKKFFMARQERTRKNDILLDDMMQRNKRIRQSIDEYHSAYSIYRCKSAKQLKDKKNTKSRVEIHRSMEPKGSRSNFCISNIRKKPITSNRENSSADKKQKKAQDTSSVPRKFHETGKSNIFQPTKINFMGTEMQIGMSKLKEQKNNVRKKILFKKTDEQFFRKYEFLTKKTIQQQTHANLQYFQLITNKKQCQ